MTHFGGHIRHAAAIGLAAILCGCAVTADPTTPQERQQRAENDRKELYISTAPSDRPLTLYQAQAYALKYNIDRRLRLMEEAATMRLNDVAGYAMLPQMALSAGYIDHSSALMSSAYTPSTGSVSSPAISTDRFRSTASLAMTWNALDFGVSYLRARQQANLVLVAQERRRKVVQNIINEVRGAYWRALNAQVLEAQLAPLAARVQNDAAVIQNDHSIRWNSPTQKLEYQRTMLEIMQQLQMLQRDVEAARMDLATLLNVEYNRKLILARPIGFDSRSVLQPVNVDGLEQLALVNRPELREEDYQARIGADETRKAMVRMLPGIEMGSSLNQDNNSFIFPHAWAEGSLKMTWNLMNLISGPDSIKAAETQEQVGELRRLSVSMAILAQVNIAARRFYLSRADYDLAESIANVDQEQLNQCGCGTKGTPQDEVDYLRRATIQLYSRYRSDASFIEVQNAAGAIAISVGNDPVPENVDVGDIETLSQILEHQAAAWSVVRQPLFKQPAPAMAVNAVPANDEPVVPAQTAIADKIARLERDPAIHRFIIFTRLVAQGHATSAEFAARRYPNLGALLPYAEPAPAIAVFDPPPTEAEMIRQLQSAKSAKARTVVLNKLLPAKVTAHTLPAARNAAALAAASSLIQTLAEVGLVTPAEAARETAAIAAAKGR